MENSKELEERCYDISPEQPMLLLERCSAIVKDDPQSMTDRRVLRRGLTELNLHPLFREKLLESLLDYDSRRQNVEENTAAVLDYRNQLKPEMLSREKRGKLIRMLILTGNIPEAFSIVKEFGWERCKGTGTSGAVQSDDLKTAAGIGRYSVKALLGAFYRESVGWSCAGLSMRAF